MPILNVQTCGNEIIRGNVWKKYNQIKTNRLYYVYHGCAYCDDKKLEKGMLYLINDKHQHNWDIPEEFGHIYFDFSISPVLNSDDIVEIELKKYPKFEDFILSAGNFLRVYKNLEIGKLMLEKILEDINKITPIFTILDKQIEQILDMIISSKKIYTIDELAQHSQMAKFHFIRVFKKQVGQTPYNFMNGLRLTRAFSLLTDGMSVKNVAMECGFSSESAFSTAFKKHFKVPPTYLKRNIP